METLLLGIVFTSVSLIITWIVEYLAYKSDKLISTLKKHWVIIAIAIILAIACIPFVFWYAFAAGSGVALSDVLILFFEVLSVSIVLGLVVERIEYSTVKKMLQANMEDDPILVQPIDVFSKWETTIEIDIVAINKLDSPLFEILMQDIHTFAP